MQMREQLVTCAFQNEQALKQHKTNLIHTQQRKSAQIHKQNASPWTRVYVGASNE